MAKPPPYVVSFSFAGYQSTRPSTPLPGVRVDTEYNNIANSITGTQAALADIRRDDGKLKNGIVTPEALDPGMALGVLPPVAWATGVQYAPPQSVWQGNKLYQCILKHVSTVFATDLANHCWNLVVDFDPPIQEATDAAAAAKISETNAKTSETNAAGSATSATASKNAAAGSASAADASKVAAASSATSAAGSATTATTQANRAQSEADRAQGIANAMTPDAPSNGTSYGRLNGAWQPVLAASAYTAADVLTKIKTVDGVGSGLDADLLDGLNSAFFAPLNNPGFTGVPTAPTPAAGDNSITLATTAFVKANIAPLAPINNPALTGTPTAPAAPPGTNTAQIATTSFVAASFVTTGAASATFAPLASPVFTGNPTAPTPAPGNNTTAIATTAFVAASYAPLNAPVFTGDARAVTPIATDNDTSIATTAFVKTAVAGTGVVATAQARNRVVNPAMQISQSQGDAASTANGTYFADQWFMTYNAGTLTGQRVQVKTPNGSRDRFRITVTAALAALIATSIARFEQPIEGLQVADFGYGAAGAKQAVLRFGFKGPAGTYTVMAANDDYTRCYLASFTITGGQANVDTEQVLVIPGDVTGTWLTNDTGAGLRLAVTLAAGATYQGVAGWQAGTKFAVAANSNGVAAAGAIYELFDVGIYLDLLNTGLPPPWQLPDVSDELARCQRYWQQAYNLWFAPCTTAVTYVGCVQVLVPMRVTPLMSMAAVSGSNFPLVAGTMSYVSGVIRENRTCNTTASAGSFGGTYTADARM